MAQRAAERDRAGQQWNHVVGPELGRLRAERDQTFAPARGRFEEREAWLADHPAIHQQLKDLARQIGDHPERDARRDVDKTHGQAMDLGL